MGAGCGGLPRVPGVPSPPREARHQVRPPTRRKGKVRANIKFQQTKQGWVYRDEIPHIC